MADKKMVFIVGAGASVEYNLPSGQSLKTEIGSLFDYSFDFNRLKTGDYIVFETLRLACAQSLNNIDDVNVYIQAARHCRAAMPQAMSIDNFLDAHQGNAAIEAVGKLGIARAILAAESRSKLNVRVAGSGEFNFTGTQQTWLDHCFQRIVEGCRPDTLAERLSSIAFVIFNYDRCVEYYLYHAIQNYYRVSKEQAAEYLRPVNFFHPYGAVGRLQWMQDENQPLINFGEETQGQKLLSVAAGIKTFTEGTDPDSSNIVALRRIVDKPKNLVFLGFGYHDQNMRLLFGNEPHASHAKTRSVFGTTYGFSDPDRADIVDELLKRWRAPRSNIHLSAATCGSLFDGHRRGLSLAR